MTALLDGLEFDVIAGLESRGFLLGMPIAYHLHKPFIPIRKKGKLPRRPSRPPMTWNTARRPSRCTRTTSSPGMRIVLVDDLIATGGTLEAAARMLTQLGAEIVQDRLPDGAQGAERAGAHPAISGGHRRGLRGKITVRGLIYMCVS